MSPGWKASYQAPLVSIISWRSNSTCQYAPPATARRAGLAAAHRRLADTRACVLLKTDEAAVARGEDALVRAHDQRRFRQPPVQGPLPDADRRRLRPCALSMSSVSALDPIQRMRCTPLSRVRTLSPTRRVRRGPPLFRHMTESRCQHRQLFAPPVLEALVTHNTCARTYSPAFLALGSCLRRFRIGSVRRCPTLGVAALRRRAIANCGKLASLRRSSSDFWKQSRPLPAAISA